MDRYAFTLSRPRKFCFNHLFAGVPEVEQMSEQRVALGRHRAVTCFDLEHVYRQRRRDWTRKSYKRRSRTLARSTFGYTLLEIAPLSLSRRSPATRWLRGVRLDRQCSTRLGKLRANRRCLV